MSANLLLTKVAHGGNPQDCTKVGKFFDYEITDGSFPYSRKREAIAEAEALDGIYILRTSGEEETLDAPSTVKAYKSLSQVEQAFRSYKTIDLKVRPIYHRLEDRVKVHVFLCEDLELANTLGRDDIIDREPEYAQGSALRAFRQLLDEKDPQRHWGGLEKVLTPEGHYLWLCGHHANEYRQ